MIKLFIKSILSVFILCLLLFQVGLSIGKAEEEKNYPSPIIKILMESEPVSNKFTIAYWEEREKAAKALGDLRDKNAIDYLIKAINFSAVNEKEHHMFSGEHPDYAKDTRAEAAIALGKIGGEKAIKALNERALIEEKPVVKLAIIEALGKIGNESSVSALTFLSKDSHRGVKIEAKNFLEKIKDSNNEINEEKQKSKGQKEGKINLWNYFLNTLALAGFIVFVLLTKKYSEKKKNIETGKSKEEKKPEEVMPFTNSGKIKYLSNKYKVEHFIVEDIFNNWCEEKGILKDGQMVKFFVQYNWVEIEQRLIAYKKSLTKENEEYGEEKLTTTILKEKAEQSKYKVNIAEAEEKIGKLKEPHQQPQPKTEMDRFKYDLGREVNKGKKSDMISVELNKRIKVLEERAKKENWSFERFEKERDLEIARFQQFSERNIK